MSNRFKKTIIQVRAFCTEFEIVCSKYHFLNIEESIQYAHHNVVDTAMVMGITQVDNEGQDVHIKNENYESPEYKFQTV